MAEPPLLDELLVRSGVAGRARTPGATELRRLAERVAAGDPGVLCGLEPFAGADLPEVESALGAVYGASPEAQPCAVDPARTVAGIAAASDAIAAASQGGGRIAFATASPASLLPLLQHLARLGSSAGAEVVGEPDSPPFRAGGRTGRFLRWFDGVAVVSDGVSLLGTDECEVADELLFTIRRPHLLVADGPFAGRAVAAGIPTVAFAGLAHLALAVAAHRGERLTVVPLATDREPAAYTPLAAVAGARFRPPPEGRRLESA